MNQVVPESSGRNSCKSRGGEIRRGGEIASSCLFFLFFKNPTKSPKAGVSSSVGCLWAQWRTSASKYNVGREFQEKLELTSQTKMPITKLKDTNSKFVGWRGRECRGEDLGKKTEKLCSVVPEVPRAPPRRAQVPRVECHEVCYQLGFLVFPSW